jgi:hypothetical protein
VCQWRVRGRITALASLQHVYRRGHTFWWRRGHRLFDNSHLEVRLSLGTADRLEARNRGAALTAASQQVVAIMDERAKAVDARPTEEELKAIARAAYGERLAQFCDDQRGFPHYANEHSVANRTWADYYDRLARNGGHVPTVDREEQAWRMAGWDAQRVANLRTAIDHVQDGNPPISQRFVDHHLRDLGYVPHDGLRRMVERALYPAYRDACLDSEKQLQASLGFGGVSSWSAPSPNNGATTASPPPPADHMATARASVPEEWLHCTPLEAAERMINETPKLLEHRREGKRAKESVGEQTLRQIRWAAILLEKSLPPATPFWTVTKQHIIALDTYFDRLSVTFGKSVHDRDPALTLEAAAIAASERVAAGTLSSDDIGLSTTTTNKHFNKLAQIHQFMRKQVSAAAEIGFAEFAAAVEEDDRDARQRYSREQGRAIFHLPPWVGCKNIGDRLAPGP